jgi:hypothetical protein
MKLHDKQVPVITTWHVKVAYGGMASRYVNMLNISNKKTSSGPPAWGLGEVLTTPHHKILRYY